MWMYKVLLLLSVGKVIAYEDDEEPILYYYGLEESERTLPPCSARQACSAFIARDWQPPALVRLCACARRLRCDTPAHVHDNTSIVPINNRDYLQFCQPITDWPICSYDATPLTVLTSYKRIIPSELEDMHHKNIQLTPPKITFECRCREPNYWKLDTTSNKDGEQKYRCGSLPYCATNEFCGNVNYDLNTLYQSCLCPRNHMCVHNGGVTYMSINEVLYQGKGWRAYCQKKMDYNDDDYYYSY